MLSKVVMVKFFSAASQVEVEAAVVKESRVTAAKATVEPVWMTSVEAETETVPERDVSSLFFESHQQNTCEVSCCSERSLNPD